MTSLLTVKMRRDLRATWPRILMMVIAIAVSLMVFSAVLYAWAATSRETRGACLGTEPASATILLDRAVDAEQMAAIVPRRVPDRPSSRRPGEHSSPVRSRSTAGCVTTHCSCSPSRRTTRCGWRTSRCSRVTGPPAPGEVLLEGATLNLLDVAAGGTLLIETPSGEPARLRVAGTVYDPSLAPAPQQQAGHGYLSTASLTTSADEAVLDQLKIQVADQPGLATPSRDRDTIVAVAGDVGAAIAPTSRQPRPEARPGQTTEGPPGHSATRKVQGRQPGRPMLCMGMESNSLIRTESLRTWARS